MKDKLVTFWQENKKPIVQVGGILAGALLGGVITALIIASGRDEIVELIDEVEIAQ